MAEGPGFYVFEDVAREWRWSLVDSNGEPVADSGEGYSSHVGALEAVQNVIDTVPQAHLHDNEPPPHHR